MSADVLPFPPLHKGLLRSSEELRAWQMYSKARRAAPSSQDRLRASALYREWREIFLSENAPNAADRKSSYDPLVSGSYEAPSGD